MPRVPAAPQADIGFHMMLLHGANPLLATLVVGVTLLLCTLLPRALKDATVLLQYRTAQLQEGTVRMNSSRQMVSTQYYMPYISDTCPTDYVPLESECSDWATTFIAQNPTYSFSSFRVMRPNTKHPAGCWFFNGKLFFNSGSSTKDCTNRYSCLCLRPKAETLSAGGTCSGPRISEGDCEGHASALMLPFSSGFEVKSFKNTKWPAGCFLNNNKLWYNTNFTGTRDCSGDVSCICLNPALLPPPGPAAHTRDCATCPVNRQVIQEDCEASASRLQLGYTSYSIISNVTSPKGCFLSNSQLFFNTASTGTQCEPTKKCICGGEYPASYDVMRETCDPDHIVNVCECRKRALELHFEVTSEEMYQVDPNYPVGCYLQNKKIWYNSASYGANCTEQRHCICAAVTANALR